MPSVARTTLALWITVTFLRASVRANSKAARMMRSDPLRVMILLEIASSSRGTSLKAAKRPGESSPATRHFLRDRAELNTGVQVLGVLAENHQVDVVLVVERVPGVGLARPQTDKKIEHLAQAHDGRPVDQTLAFQFWNQFFLCCPDRFGGDGAEHGRVHVLEQVDRTLGKASPSLHQNSQPISPCMYSASN